VAIGEPTMKVAYYTRYGPPAVVQIADVAKPVPKADDVLVRVHATTVCATDAAIRRGDNGLLRLMLGVLKPRRPMVGGVEFSGQVVEIGKAVTRFGVGDLIFGNPGLQAGAHAEYLCIPESGAIQVKPANMGLDEAACVACGGMTALLFLRLAKIGPGQDVLVYGASGAVGVFAVQLAKHAGARVTAVCSAANHDLIRSLGADAVVDYTREDFAAGGPIYDVVVDAVGKSGFARGIRALKPGGAYVLIGGPFLPGPRRLLASLTGAAKVIGPFASASAISSAGLAGEMAVLSQMIEAGELRTVIGRRFSFGEIAEAHAYTDSGHKVGNALVIMEP
jgi:NADPH:quinone reductase-like Zn-dependent oxidoreductase